jgi:hypothetical protein
MDDREMLHRWVEAWRNAGPELERIHREEVRTGDNLQILAQLEDAFNHAARSSPPRPTSGMIEMQQWFAKLSR